MKLPDGWTLIDDHIEIQAQSWAAPILIDIDDFRWLVNLHWTVHRAGRHHFYAVTYATVNGKRKMYKMHRLIMSAKSEIIIDHEDGNGLNNRRSNLRRATHSQNAANAKLRKSTLRGVTYRAERKKPWIAQIRCNYHAYYIGSFDDELVAAAAYDWYARALFGEFAELNFNVHFGYVNDHGVPLNMANQ